MDILIVDAPLRLHVPVKLSLKNIKAITRITYIGANLRTTGQSARILVMTEFEFAVPRVPDSKGVNGVCLRVS
jgi:hypothetical protein